MAFTYILFSKQINRFYIGSTKDIVSRMEKHLQGTTRFTSRANDWIIVYKKEFGSYHEALLFEKHIKKQKSRSFILNLINTNS